VSQNRSKGRVNKHYQLLLKVSGFIMLKAGYVVNEAGRRPRCIVTEYDKSEISDVMQDIGKTFVVERIEWNSQTGEAVVHLRPSNGVDWQYDLVRGASR